MFPSLLFTIFVSSGFMYRIFFCFVLGVPTCSVSGAHTLDLGVVGLNPMSAVEIYLKKSLKKKKFFVLILTI